MPLLDYYVPEQIYLIAFIILLVTFGATMIFVAARLKKCPADKIMVIYGKGPTKCVHGGVHFVWPFIQGYSFLDISPISLSIDLKEALTKDNVPIDVPARFAVGISTEEGVMQIAAERLLGLPISDIQELARDILLNQLLLTVASMNFEKIYFGRDRFLEKLSGNAESELKKTGLKLINVNFAELPQATSNLKKYNI